MTSRQRQRLIEELRAAYNDEVESALNYLSNGHRLRGLDGEDLSEDMLADAEQEFGHAQDTAELLHTHFNVVVPSSNNVTTTAQEFLHHNETVVASDEELLEIVLSNVVAEAQAVRRWGTIVELAEEVNLQDVKQFAVEKLHEEREHLDESASHARTFTPDNESVEEYLGLSVHIEEITEHDI